VRGRLPKPARLKAVEGNPGKRRLRDEPTLPVGAEAPPGLSSAAKAEWDALAPVLTAMGALTAADGPALAILCELLAEFRRLAAQGKPSSRIAGEVRQYFSRFGMTPADRARIGTAPARPESAADVPDEVRDVSLPGDPPHDRPR
jgi:phage terminase small subunit